MSIGLAAGIIAFIAAFILVVLAVAMEERNQTNHRQHRDFEWWRRHG
jgi:hypothetical protein